MKSKINYKLKLKLTVMALTPLLLIGSVSAQTAKKSNAVQEKQKISISNSSSRSSNKAPAENFTGGVTVSPLIEEMSPSRLTGSNVTFEAGARTNWHSHPLGQTLIVTKGTGRVQQWNGSIEEIREGDVVRIPPGVKHWHGGAPDSAMTHLALVEKLNKVSATWMEKVTDAQYNQPIGTRKQSASVTDRRSSAVLLIKRRHLGESEQIKEK